MASWRQAATAIRDLVQAIVDPTAQPPTAVFVGWPEPNKLLANLRATPPNPPTMRAAVSIYPTPIGRNSSRYNKEPDVIKIPATMSMSIVGTVVTLAGIVTPGDNVFIYINKKPYSTSVLMGDTVGSVATRLAGVVNAANVGITATPSGVTITLAGLMFQLAGAVYGRGQVLREISRRERAFQVTTWASDPDTRSAVSGDVEIALDSAEFLTYPDTSLGRIVFHSSLIDDGAMTAGIFRHDLMYMVEYPIFSTEVVASVGDIQILETRYGLDGTPFTDSIDNIFGQ